jgi:uncharacterized protein (TIGR03067 family)
MRVTLLLALLIAFSLDAAPVPKGKAKPEQDPGKADLKMLQGEWECVSQVSGGLASSVPAGARTVLIRESRLTFFKNGMEVPKNWTITLDAKTNPKSMDLNMRRGESKAMAQAVYAIAGDTLRISFISDGKRPTNLDGVDPAHTVHVYRRKKP